VLPCYVPYTILQMHCLVMILYYTYQVGLNYSVFTQFYIGQKKSVGLYYKMINVNVSNENNIETFKTLLILKITL